MATRHVVSQSVTSVSFLPSMASTVQAPPSPAVGDGGPLLGLALGAVTAFFIRAFPDEENVC